MTTKMIDFNLNNYVEVVLTKRGAEIWNTNMARYTEWSPVENKFEGDILREQMWYVMQVFGEHMMLCCEVPFKDCLLKFEAKD